MQRDFTDLWRIFPEHALPGRTWHWWWWLYFFENPEKPDHPRQLMILWGNRNCKKVCVNDFRWEPKIPIEVKENSSRFESIVAAWYFDGKKMRDPFILESGPTETTWSDNDGSIMMKSDRGKYTYAGKHADFTVLAENPDVSLDLRMTRWTDEMAKLVPTGKNFFGNMGYTMLKYRGLLASGKIRAGESTIDVKGRCYFQKVRISSVTPCWYWATIQWDNGSYLQYFLPHVGIPMLRQKLSHESAMDWGEKFVSRTLNFYDADHRKEYLMKDVEIEKHYENDLPVFRVIGRDESADAEIEVEMATYARCCWDIAQPFIGPWWLGIFYNEYPARVTDFRFKSGSRKIGMNDMGGSFCNCEHTWGTI